MNNITWVQGEAGAKAYMVAPNNTIALWDSEAQVIYIKETDMMGRPSMQILDYTIRNKPKDEMEVLKEEIENLKKQIKEMSNESIVSEDEPTDADVKSDKK